MKVYAPGKLILSGEHAVVHGSPALVMAVNKYVTASITRERLPQILFDLSDLAHQSHLSFAALRHLKNRVKRKYQRFICGDVSIREVLQKPFELAQFALGVFADALNLSLPHGIKMQVESTIPMGCGMGSSAATIVSVMHAASHYLNIPLSEDALFQLALEAENMQHGHSSGLDVRIALQGGCLYLQDQVSHARPIPTFSFYLVNTGMPITTTGQCVEHVAPHFKSQQLQQDFAGVTQAMDSALQMQSMQNMAHAVRENHKLLQHIGVVPKPVASFIQEIEKMDGAAKICGAGAVGGDRAGAVLVIMQDSTALSAICSRFGYNVIPILGESRGVHAA